MIVANNKRVDRPQYLAMAAKYNSVIRRILRQVMRGWYVSAFNVDLF